MSSRFPHRVVLEEIVTLMSSSPAAAVAATARASAAATTQAGEEPVDIEPLLRDLRAIVGQRPGR